LTPDPDQLPPLSHDRPARLRFAGNRRVEIADDPEPFPLDPGDGEVRVRLEGTGVCQSNVPPFEGRDWFEYPMPPGQPGHEGWGVVEAVGPDVTGLREGDRVATLAQDVFATHCVCDADGCVKLPDSLAGMPFPGEPLACVMNVADRCRIKPGQEVLLIGGGFLGLLLTQLLSRRRVRVTAVSRRETGRAFAERAGAERVLTPEALRAEADAVGGFFDGGRYDVVIETAGKQEAIDQASKLVAEMGRLVLAGFHQDGPRTVDMQLWNWRGLEVTNAHEREPAKYAAGLRRAVEAVEAGELDPTPLITHRLPMHQLGRALRLAADRPESFVKAVVELRPGASA
jgi:threonine dehydrogenase-like Zn-dependent dehydrogenase